jgi:hypothetical protein
MSIEQRYAAFEKAKNYTKQYQLDKIDSIVTRQEDGMLGYISAGQFATTGSNIFTEGQIILGNLTIDGDVYVNNVVSSSILYKSGSTKFGNSFDDTHQFTGSVYITGSTTQIGNNTLLGDTQLYGTIDVSGSTNFHNHTITMTGSMYTSGSQIITGSLDIKGNVNVASGSEFYLHGNKLFNYGQFSDTTTQSGSANTAYAKKLNTIDFAHEVSVVSGSRITVANTGIYNLQFSSQLENTTNSNITFDIWLAYTGSNYPNTNTQIDVTKVTGGLGRQVAAWNFMLPIKANDYVELMWSCNASTGQLASMGTQTNPNRPAIPSVIATLTQIG